MPWVAFWKLIGSPNYHSCGMVSLFCHWYPICGEKPFIHVFPNRSRDPVLFLWKCKWVSCVKIKLPLLKVRDLNPSLYLLRKMTKTTSYQPWECSAHMLQTSHHHCWTVGGTYLPAVTAEGIEGSSEESLNKVGRRREIKKCVICFIKWQSKSHWFGCEWDVLLKSFLMLWTIVSSSLVWVRGCLIMVIASNS